MKKPKEFWIEKRNEHQPDYSFLRAHEDQTRFLLGEQPVHVIEKSAYDKLKAELEKIIDLDLDLPIGTYMKWREIALAALKAAEGE